MDRLAFRPIEAAELAGVSVHTIHRRVDTGELPAKRMGKRVLILADDLRAYMDFSKSAK